MEKNTIKKFNNLHVLIALIISISGCGGSHKGRNPENLSLFFPEELEGISLVCSSDIVTYKGQSLYEYIDGGAEIYHLYGFIEVATASYKTGGHELVLDIYRFDTDDDAYGLFSSIKPAGPGNVQLGIEGFSTENSIDFVKGSYLVRIVGFDQTGITKTAIEKLAENLDATIPGSNDKPAMFTLFSRDSLIPGSEMIQSESFMGQIFLSDFYSMKYKIEGDEITLFVSEDPNGEKYDKWLGEVEPVEFDPGRLPYDKNKSFLYDDDFHGHVLAGLIQGKLAGIVGYKENHREFLSRWLKTLTKAE